VHDYDHGVKATAAQNRSQQKETAMKIRLEDGQIAYVVGGNQMNSNMNSSAPQVLTLAWGTQVPKQTPQPIFQGLSWSPAYGWGNSFVGFFTNPTPSQYINILGGTQKNSNVTSEAPWIRTLNWGLETGEPVEIAAAQSWSDAYGWGNSQISFAYIDENPWLTIVGGYQECNNITSSASWIKVSSWGQQEGPKALIAQCQAYSNEYQFGNSRVFLYFAEDSDSSAATD
jgi:hypothetical protein